MKLFLLAFLFLALFVGLFVPGSSSPPILQFLIITSLLAIIYWLIIKQCKEGLSKSNLLFGVLIGIAIVVRLLVPFLADNSSYLSDDVFRYIWEGKLIAHGGNPYVTSPDDMETTVLADTVIYPFINHSDLPTIYPPLAQAVFVLSYYIGGDTIIGFKLLSLIAELLAIVAMMFLVRGLNLPRSALLIYLFCPLVLVEFLMSNHIDIFAIAPLTMALLFFHRRQGAMTGLFLTLAILVKFLPILFVPIIIRELDSHQRLKFIAVASLTGLLFYAPFIADSGLNVTGSLFTYLSQWEFNGSLFPILKMIFGHQWARWIASTILLGAIGWSVLDRKRLDPFARMLVLFAIYLSLSAALFPWYLIWVLPLLVIHPWRPLIILLGTITLSYHVLIDYYTDGSWNELWWVTLLLYLPAYLFVLIDRFDLSKRKITEVI